MRIRENKLTIGHLLTTLTMAAGLVVWIVSYAEDLTAVEVQQQAIIETQKVEANYNKERSDDAKKRMERIEKGQDEIIKLLRQSR